MADSLKHSAVSSHPVLPDMGKARMAKVDVRIPDEAWNQLIGRAIQRAVAFVGWTNKEAAAKVGVDDAEFGKWLSGGRRPQFDKLFAIEELREPLCAFLSEIAGAVVRLQIAFERKAG
jgi:hypothetical protein